MNLRIDCNYSYNNNANYSYALSCNTSYMDTIGQRIKNLRIEYGYSQEELAEKLGLSRVAITKWESGQTANLKLDNIIGICKIFDISISYLITGEPFLENEIMSGINIEEIRRSNLKKWTESNSTPEKEKSYFSQLINGKTSFGEKAARRLESEYLMGGFFLDKVNSEEIINPSVKTIRIPRFIAKGSMGEGIEQPDHDTITGELQLSESWTKEHLKGVSSYKNLAVITGKGDSMETTFHDGDVLFVDTGIKNFVTNGVYVFSVNHNLFIKRLSRKLDGEIIATCDNPAMQHLIERPGEHGYVIHGKVVGAWNWKRV